MATSLRLPMVPLRPRFVGNSELKLVPKLTYPITADQLNSGQVQWVSDAPKRERTHYMKIDDSQTINWKAIGDFVTSSCDSTLLRLAKQSGVKITCSTSSSTSFLSHLYFMVSRFKELNVKPLINFSDDLATFTARVRRPVVTILRKRPEYNDIWAIDSHPGKRPPSNQILINVGFIVERKLTTSPTEFNSKYIKNESRSQFKYEHDAYRFTRFQNMLVRAQLDCIHEGINGNSKIFDLKTRATKSIRYNVEEYEKHKGYKIHRLLGKHNSFEKEIYDMARSAFLKYCRFGSVRLTHPQ